MLLALIHIHLPLCNIRLHNKSIDPALLPTNIQSGWPLIQDRLLVWHFFGGIISRDIPVHHAILLYTFEPLLDTVQRD